MNVSPVRRMSRALIVVVERDPHIRELERYFLEEAGYQVEFATDGESGLELARRLKPSILLTEILIPRKDGLSVCREIKSDPETRHIVVLVFSMLDAEDRAFEAGADGFFPKPLNASTLIESVRRAVERPLDAEAGS